jgi:uncharacterized protein
MALETTDYRLPPGEVAAQQGLRRFMAGVYGWMMFGLLVTGVVALYMTSQPQVLGLVARYYLLFFAAQLAMVIGLSAVAERLSAGVAGLLFIVYAGLTGVTFGLIFYMYTAASIASAFLMTGGAFGAMSVYATVTKRALSGWRTFLVIGFFGVFIGSIVQYFWPLPMLNFILGCAGVVVFAGLTAYDTQKLREVYLQAGSQGVASMSIIGALRLYLDFINLFISLLRLFGGRRS